MREICSAPTLRMCMTENGESRSRICGTVTSEFKFAFPLLGRWRDGDGLVEKEV
jgi:hypothetical protein